MLTSQEEMSKAMRKRRITNLNRYSYNFDWQENKGYEEIEELNKRIVKSKEVNPGKCMPEKTGNKGIGCNCSNKSSVRKAFGLRSASGFIK